MSLVQLALPLGAAFIGGAMNSVAGGGSFLTFPALIFAGIPAISANATNNAAMWVGVIGAARGYREEVREYRRFLAPVVAVSVVGSLIGSILLLRTPSLLFERLIPFLLLFATLVFAVSPLLNRRTAGVAFQARGHNRWQLLVQFFVAVYGGYFGAGMGILMLAILAFSGLPTLNAQNGIKNVLSVSINGVALIPFVLARVVDWRFAIPMAVIALAGGYFGARLFRRVPPRISRVLVIAIGLTMSAVFMRRLL